MAVLMSMGRKWVLVIVCVAAIALVLLVAKGIDHNEDTDKAVPEINWKTINVANITPEQIVEYFLWGNQSSCKLAHDFGGIMLKNPSGLDGQKAVCLDTEVAPKAGNCIVYSFGINNEWSFDDNMEKYGCKVYSFDPSMKREDHNRSSAISFYNLGISYQDKIESNGWKLKTLSSIYSMLKPIHGDVVIDYLKMDIESAEWGAIPDIIKSGMLAKVRQLGVEFHWYPHTELSYCRTWVEIVKSIEDAGMIRFDSKYNPWFMGNIPAFQNFTGSLGYEIAWYQNLP